MATALFAAFVIPHLVTQAQVTLIAPATAASGEDASPSTAAPAAPAIEKVLRLKITAYTSLVAETKSYGSPYITADGSYVHDGVVATNLLPFGTKVMIPSLFGDEVFTVDDRMSAKLMDNMDVWMPTYRQAIVFGAHTADVEVLAPSAPAVSTTTLSNALNVASETLAMLAIEVRATGSISPGPSVRQL